MASDLGVAVARTIIQVKTAHGALHMIYAESRVLVHHHLDVLVFRRESLNTYVLGSVVGNCLAHLLELRARERLFHKVGVRIWSVLHVGVGELVHFRSDHFVSDLVVLRDKLSYGLSCVIGRPSLILVLEYK